MEKENKFVGYEYENVTVKSEMESLWKDGYKNFGWKVEKSKPSIVKHVWDPIRIMIAPLAIFPGGYFSKMLHDHESDSKVHLSFKRDKDIERKVELNRLQLQFKNSAEEIDHLEKSKGTIAAITAYAVGMIGTVFMGYSVFSYLAASLNLSIIMAVPGFAGWILSYFIYRKVKNNTIKNVEPLIEKQYSTIYSICEKANGLLED